MIAKWFRCLRCRHEFKVEVVDPDEARRERIPTRPIACPKCGGPVEG